LNITKTNKKRFESFVDTYFRGIFPRIIEEKEIDECLKFQIRDILSMIDAKDIISLSNNERLFLLYVSTLLDFEKLTKELFLRVADSGAAMLSEIKEEAMKDEKNKNLIERIDAVILTQK